VLTVSPTSRQVKEEKGSTSTVPQQQQNEKEQQQTQYDSHQRSCDLSGVDILTGAVIVPPWRRKRAHLPAHLKVAGFWRCDLLENCRKEEKLGVSLPRPMTARQLLGIDIYTARGLWKVFRVRTIEGLVGIVKTQMLLRGEEHVITMLLESCYSLTIVKQILAGLGKLISSGPEEEEARIAWDAVHRGSERGGVVGNNKGGNRRGEDEGAEDPRILIQELRERERHHQELFEKTGHHHHHYSIHGHHIHGTHNTPPQHSRSLVHAHAHDHGHVHHHRHHSVHNQYHDRHSSITFGSNSNAQVAKNLMIASLASNLEKKRDSDETVLDTLLFEDSGGSEDEDEDEIAMNLGSGQKLMQRDSHLLGGDEKAVRGATYYRRCCDKHSTFPVNSFISQLCSSCLSLSKTKIGPANFLPIVDTLLHLDTFLETLDLSGCSLAFEGGEMLSTALQKMLKLKELNISDNNFSAEACGMISEALRSNTYLHSLNFSKNSFDDSAAEILGHTLDHNKYGLLLNLSYNNLTDVGVKHLATTCVHNLHELNLEWNQIGGDGMIALADELKRHANEGGLRRGGGRNSDDHNEKLEVLNINFNKVGGRGGAAIAEVLMFNNSLRELYATNNNLNAEAAYLISQSLSYIKSLHTLDLSYNNLTKYSVNCLLQALNNDASAVLTDLRVKASYVAPQGQTTLVPDLELKYYKLNLEDSYDHCVAEFLRAKTVKYQLNSIAHVSNKPIVDLGDLAGLPRRGVLTFAVGESSRQQGRTARLLVAQNSIPVKLDLADTGEREVARSHFSQVNRWGDFDVNKMALEALSVSNVMYNGNRVVVTEQWFDSKKDGYLTYTIRDPALLLQAKTICVLNSESDSRRLQIQVEKIWSGELSQVENIFKCRFKGSLSSLENGSAGADDDREENRNNGEDEEIINFDLAKYQIQVAANEENGLKRKKSNSRPMKNIHSSLVKLPSAGVLEMEVIPVRNSFVHMETVDLTLSNFDDWKLATIFMHRSRCCVGECCLNLSIDAKRLKVFDNKMISDSVLLPRKGRFKCDYIVTRPTKSLLRGSRIEGESFSLDLSYDPDYELCMYLRSFCIGVDVSTRSCWTKVKLNGQKLPFAKVVSEECWRVPRSGVITFCFVPVTPVFKSCKPRWLQTVQAALADCTNDMSRVELIRVLKRSSAFNISVSQMESFLSSFLGMEMKRKAFALLLPNCNEILKSRNIVNQINFIESVHIGSVDDHPHQHVITNLVKKHKFLEMANRKSTVRMVTLASKRKETLIESDDDGDEEEEVVDAEDISENENNGDGANSRSHR